MVSRSGRAVDESRPMMTVPPEGMGIALPLSCPFSTTSSGIESSARLSSTGNSPKSDSRHRFRSVARDFLPKVPSRRWSSKLYKNTFENGSPDSNVGGSFFHRDFVILGHPHRQVRDAGPGRHLPQAPEMGPRVGPLGGHRHETQDLEGPPGLGHGSFHGLRAVSSLGRFAADVHLNKDGHFLIALFHRP